ncbi:MAG TPA: TrbC/VirB2 family protein [Ochrobactrum sp.]|nr:TrbC/VirB2 family protein [Ochrobactrum sp.]
MSNDINNDWRVPTAKLAICLSLLAAMQIAGADLAMAAGDNAMDPAFAPVKNVLEAIVNFINGDFGRLLAVLAVTGLGFLAFAGRLSWFFAGSVILGIGLMFGAKTMVDALKTTVGG